MKKTGLRAVSAILASALLFSVAGCGKNSGGGNKGQSRSGDKITEDMPWFDSNMMELKNDFGSSLDIETVYSQFAGADEKNIVVFTSGYYKFPDSENMDWDNFDYNSYTISNVSVIDRDSFLTVQSIDLKTYLGDQDYVETVTYKEGIITVKSSSYDETTFQSISSEINIEADTGKLLDIRESEFSGVSVERVFDVNGYTLKTEMIWGEEKGYYNVYICDPDGNEKAVEIKSPDKDIYDIPVVISSDDTHVLIPASTSDKAINYELDLVSGQLNVADDKKYEWLDLSGVYNTFSSSDGYTYFSTSTGISKIDFKNKCTEEYFNFSNCNISRNKMQNLQLADVNEDSFLLCGEIYTNQGMFLTSKSAFYMIEFSKADKNPNAGKTVLEIYANYGYTSDAISEAILKFNQTNNECFILVEDYYSEILDSADYSAINSDDDMTDVQLGVDSKMSNQLAMDIINGEGPDILLNINQYGQLNNENYLTDLTPYVSGLDPEKYYTNVLEAAKCDGKLYSIPLTFTIEGIQTRAEYAGSSGVGFTTEEYEKFLKETLNGRDVISAGQPYYFTKLFNNMSDKFIINGKVDLSVPEFKALAEFVKNNVRKNSSSWDELYAEESVSYAPAVGAVIRKGDNMTSMPASLVSCYGFSAYLINCIEMNNAASILGMPSSDGRGPILGSYDSIAVSAQTHNADACGEFIKIMLSDEIQQQLAAVDNLCLSRERFRENAAKMIEYYNSKDGAMYFAYGYDPATGNSPFKISEQSIDDFEKIILSCSKMYSSDADIDLILIEEMPAYFSGQKDLDSVIAIAQDRAQKVLAERG